MHGQGEAAGLQLGRLLGSALLCIFVLGALMVITPFALAQESGGTVVLEPTASVMLKRFALVIGNGAYRHVQSLRNPESDAAAITAKLRQLGYSVV